MVELRPWIEMCTDPDNQNTFFMFVLNFEYVCHKIVEVPRPGKIWRLTGQVVWPKYVQKCSVPFYGGQFKLRRLLHTVIVLYYKIIIFKTIENVSNTVEIQKVEISKNC